MDKQTSLPKLRFSEFKKVWQVDLLGNLSDKLVVGFVGTCEKYYTSKENGVPMLRTGNLKDGRLELEDLKYVTKEFHKKNVKSQLKKGDILIPRHGSNGKGVLFDCSFDANSLNFVIFRTNKLYLDSIFTVNSFYTKFLENQVTSVVAGSTQGVINTSEIGKLKIFYPSLPEQVKIAKFLTSVEEKLSLLKRKKSLLSQYKKGVMQQLFSQELRFKDEKGNDFVDWNLKMFYDIASVNSAKYNPDKNKISYKCIELEHLASDEGELLGFVDSSNLGSIKNKFEKGDVLFGKLRPYLKKYLRAPFDGVCSSEIWVLKGKEVSNDFLYWIIQTDFFICLANQSTGSKMPRADWNVISNSELEIPSLAEQTKIASFLSALDDKISQTAAQIEKMQLWKKGLLQQMFV